MNYNEFSIITDFLNPVSDQGPVLIKAETMMRIPAPQIKRLCTLFFEGREEITITRQILFNIQKGNIEKFLLSVLFWGYPQNQRGRCTAAIKNWEALTEWVRVVRNNREMTIAAFADLFPMMQAVQGLGISTFSKILYFLGASIDGHKCLILDDMVARGISNLNGREFEQIKMAVLNRYRYYRHYPDYLSAIDNLALRNHVTGDSVEYALWLAGKKNR